MSVYKEDIIEAKERLSAWWDHEIIDRPCICYFHPRSDVPFKGIYDLWYLAKHWDGFEGCLNDFEEKSESIHFGAETIPWFWPNYGPGIMASVFGIEPKYEETSNTVWFSKEISIDELVPHLESVKLNQDNEWYSRLLKVHEYAAKRGGQDYSVAITDLGGIIDVLSSFLGPTNLILEMKRHPEIIDTCRAIITEKWLQVFDDLQNVIEKYQEGCNNWLPIWCPKRWYPIQSDFSAMLSPKYFKRFVLPDLITQAEHLDYAIYHLDGPRQLVHLDDLLAEPSINGIQWVPGAGEESAEIEKWMPVYQKIQDARKNLIIDNPIDTGSKEVTKLYKKLDPKGLIMILIFLTEMNAQYYLPDFVGGNYAKGDFRAFKREYRKQLRKKKKHKNN